jgi:hypothetical protein
MTIKKTLRLPIFVALALVAGTAPAIATPQEEAPTPWPPEDTGGKYLPVPDDYYAPIEFEACGTTVTMEAADVRDVHYKSRVKQNGSTVLKFKGDATVDLTRASDGAFIDELDISGTAYQYISADELTLVDLLGGRSIVAAASPEEAELMAEEGLPEVAYYTRGWLGFYSQFSEDPKVMEPIASDIVLNTTRHVHDVCEMLDEAAWE